MSPGPGDYSVDIGPHGDHKRHGQADGHGNCEPHHLCSTCALTVPIIDHGVLQPLIKQTGTDESIGGVGFRLRLAPVQLVSVSAVLHNRFVYAGARFMSVCE